MRAEHHRGFVRPAAALAVLAGTWWMLPLQALGQSPADKPADKPVEPPKAEPSKSDTPAADPPKSETPDDSGGGSRRRRPKADEPSKAEPGAAEAKSQEPVAPINLTPPVGFDQPLGFAGEGTLPERRLLPRETVAIPDRWRIGWPTWDRYNRQAKSDPLFMNAEGGDSPYTLGSPWNPYDRNVLKGDYPVIGDDIFINVSATSDTLFQYRKNPTPSGVSAQNPGSFSTFGDGSQYFVNQNFVLSFDMFEGYTAYRPVDWLVHISPVFNLNYLKLQENQTDVSPVPGDERYRTFTALQEAFLELHLGDTSPNFDIAAIKLGRQLFVSDFRGFIYNDFGDGVRLFGNAMSNRIQYNLAFFNQTEKDTNSGLDELQWRDQQVLIANVYLQDFLFPGYTIQGSFHWNHDYSNDQYDSNGFPVRPGLAGDFQLSQLDVYYLGLAGDGHIGRFNIDNAFYYAFGRDRHNELAGQEINIGAYMGAVEVSYDMDWFRPKASFLYASGDSNPTDNKGGGFDGIMDDPSFAGGPSSYFQNQGLRLFGLGLKSSRSLYNALNSSKIQGQANFVNPGTMLVNVGFDAELTPKVRYSLNANAIWFADTSSLEYFTNQNDIPSSFGYEINNLVQYRPFLNNNIILTVSGSVFFPSSGFNAIYSDNKTLYQVFTGITLTY